MTSWLDRLFGESPKTLDQDLLLLVGRWQEKGVSDRQIAATLNAMAKSLHRDIPGISSQGA
jgi:IS30 family transposase